MELKIAGAMSTELAEILSELNIYQVSFSKYGRGYVDYMYQTNVNLKNGFSYQKGDVICA